jgi:hypothetical protein
VVLAYTLALCHHSQPFQSDMCMAVQLDVSRMLWTLCGRVK